MRQALRIILPFAILAICGFAYWWFLANKEKPRQFTPPPQVTQVEGKTLTKTDYQVTLQTRGTVTPRTVTTLFPEVSGRIVSISPNFREGGFFEKDEILLSIEKLDYETALVIAKSQLAQARSALEEEKARGNQAAENWRRLGKSGKPSDMVLRIPQFEEAEARYHAAEADVEKARRDLERTDIKAPYAGRILEQRVDVGQYVSTGTQLGRAFSTDVMEVRLPLTNQQLGFVDLPETFRNTSTEVEGPDVVITAKVGQARSSWNGKVVRVDSSIDESSRQLFVVAQIEDPYRAPKPGGAALKIGMFVDAVVEGRKLRDVFVLPRASVRVSGEVVLIDPESKIQRREVKPMWKGETEIVIPGEGGGLSQGDVLCLTPLAYPANGTLVIPTIDGVPRPIENIPGLEMPGKGKGKGKSKGKSKGKAGGEPAGKRPPGSFSGKTKGESAGS